MVMSMRRIVAVVHSHAVQMYDILNIRFNSISSSSILRTQQKPAPCWFDSSAGRHRTSIAGAITRLEYCPNLDFLQAFLLQLHGAQVTAMVSHLSKVKFIVANRSLLLIDFLPL